MHLFSPCCILAYVLAEIGIQLETWTDIHFEQFQRLESDYYDNTRRCSERMEKLKTIKLGP